VAWITSRCLLPGTVADSIVRSIIARVGSVTARAGEGVGPCLPLAPGLAPVPNVISVTAWPIADDRASQNVLSAR